MIWDIVNEDDNAIHTFGLTVIPFLKLALLSS